MTPAPNNLNNGPGANRFQSAIHAQFVWKTEEVRAFAVSLIKHAMALDGGASNFTTDIVPDEDRSHGGRPQGPGIAGTSVEILKNAGLLKPVGIVENGTFFQHRLKSTRPGRNGAWLNVYQLTARPLAEEFLKRHGQVPLQQQLTLV